MILCRNEVVSIIVSRELERNVSADTTVSPYWMFTFFIVELCLLLEFNQFSLSLELLQFGPYYF
jgi:hypothetical protein